VRDQTNTLLSAYIVIHCGTTGLLKPSIHFVSFSLVGSELDLRKKRIKSLVSYSLLLTVHVIGEKSAQDSLIDNLTK